MNLDTILTILQQSEYDLKKTREWMRTHHGEANVQQLQPEKWTMKLQLIKLIVNSLRFLSIEKRLQVALGVVAGPELAIRKITYARARKKLRSLQTAGLKTVAIAGSYGKTSTKHILNHALSNQLRTVATEKSINTILGLSQFILKELKPEHQLCVFEFGEFTPGDLKAMTDLIQPQYGILTPIGRQHVERFGSIEGLIEEFNSFAHFFMSTPEKLLSAEENIASFPQFPSYGEDQKNTVHLEDVQVTTGGTDFRVVTTGEPVDCFIPLLGKHQAKNVLPTFWLSDQLQLNIEELRKNLKSLPFVPHRHEPSFIHDGIVLLDNGYNSNPDSAVSSLELLKELSASQKAVITMGFVELGEHATDAHREFGEQIAKVANILGVVDTSNAEALIEGFESAQRGGIVLRGKNPVEVWKNVQTELKPNSIVLFENGYQEQYS